MKRIKYKSILLVLLNTIDAGLTSYFVSKWGSEGELNPLMKSLIDSTSIEFFFVWKVSFIVTLVSLVYLSTKKYKTIRSSNIALNILLVVYVIIVAMGLSHF